MTLLSILSSLLFAVSANIDSIVVGLSLGVKNIKLGITVNLLIACILSAITVLSICAGQLFNIYISGTISKTIGGGLLILIGLYSLWKALAQNRRKRKAHSGYIKSYFEVMDSPEKADVDRSGNIDAKESVLLAVALSLNNLGMGIGVGITGLDILLTAAFSFVLSIVFLSAGTHLGRRCMLKAFGKRASIAAALLIIFLGIFEAIS